MNEKRDKFLVEVGEGGCWNTKSDWWCPKCLTYIDGHQVTFEETHQTCGTSVFVKDINPDFSKWENMGRLLDLAVKKELYVDIWIRKNKAHIEVTKSADSDKVEHDIAISAIPDITADLIVQALGGILWCRWWVVVKK